MNPTRWTNGDPYHSKGTTSNSKTLNGGQHRVVFVIYDLQGSQKTPSRPRLLILKNRVLGRTLKVDPGFLTLGCSKIEGRGGGHMYRFCSDFDWLILHDQTELDDKRGIQVY